MYYVLNKINIALYTWLLLFYPFTRKKDPSLKHPSLLRACILDNTIGEPPNNTHESGNHDHLKEKDFTARSLFQHSQPSQSHGRRCVQPRDSNHHGLTLQDLCQPKSFAKMIIQRTSSRSKWVGSAKHNSTSLNSVESLPNHGDHRSRDHVPDQTGEEWLSLEISII